MLNAELRDMLPFTENEFKKLSLGNKLHVPTHLSTALKASLKEGAYSKSAQILLDIIRHGQCSRHFALQIISMLFVKTSCHRSLEFSELAGVFSKITLKSKKGLASYEATAIVLFNLIRNGQYEQAYDEVCRHEDLFSTASCGSSINKSALAAILLIYKFTLQMFMANFEQHDDSDQSKMIESLLSRNYLLPLLAEAYIVTLARVNGHLKARFNGQAKIEKFIYRYVESQSNLGWGVSSHEHILAILNAHSYRVSESVKFNILEEISQRDPGNPKVLELCRMHLIMDQRQKKRKTKCESDIGTESEISDTDDFSDSENLDMCLELVLNFLDTQMHKQVNSCTSVGWSLLADVLRRICIKGTYGCIKKLTNLWHMDRKDWWTYFRNPNFKEEAVNDVVRNKALVCYLLESDAHPFVKKSLSLKNSNHLGSLIKQFKPSKRKMDEIIKTLSDGKQFSSQLLVSAPPKDTLQSQTRLGSFLSKYQHLDSQKMAETFSRHLGRQPLAPKNGDYKREATAQHSTQDLYQLPISERLTKRYEQRRCSTPRSRRSSEGNDDSSSPDVSKSFSDAPSEAYGSPGSAGRSASEELAKKKAGGTKISEPREPSSDGLISYKTEPGKIGCAIEPNVELPSIRSESDLLEDLSQKSSNSELFVPSEEDIECNSSALWTTRLRSWCLNKVPTCYEIQDLTCHFVENFEKFKAENNLSGRSETAQLFRWQKFLDNASWQTSSDNGSSCANSNDEDLERSSTNASSAAGINQSLDCYANERSSIRVEQYDMDRQSHNNSSVYSVCGSSSITDYPNRIDRVLRRLSCNDVLPLGVKIEETEYVVEADVNQLSSSPCTALNQRESFSPDMFTDYESALESLKSSPTSNSISSKNINGDLILSNNPIDKRVEMAAPIETTKRGEEVEIPSFPGDEPEVVRGIKRTRKLEHNAIKTARRSSHDKEIMSGPKEADKISKRKDLQKSWSISDSFSSKFTAEPGKKGQTEIVKPKKRVRRKMPSRKPKRNFAGGLSDDFSKGTVSHARKAEIAVSGPGNKSSSSNLHDWSASLVDQILMERRKST